MKKLILILGLATTSQFSALNAQLAPVNELGLSIGHLHIFPADREKEMKAFMALGGQLEANLSGNIPVGFPGIIVLIGAARPGNLGSAGSVIDHVAFRVPDLAVASARLKGVQTWWKNGTWFSNVEAGASPKQLFVTTPGGIRIEVIEDKSLKMPVTFDHVHYFIEEAKIPEMEEYYKSNFGAKPVKGEPNTLSMPGGKLIFSKATSPVVSSSGRTLDHVGFNMLNSQALAAYSEKLVAKGVKLQGPYRPSSMGMTRMTDPVGITIEVTKAQGGYFDPKLLDAGYLETNEAGLRQGEKPKE